MPVKGKTVRRLGASRYLSTAPAPEIKLKSHVTMYEVHSGILNYRTGAWITHHPTDLLLTLASARSELKWRQDHPKAGQNAAYIIRRYRHGSNQKTETTAAI